MFGISKRLIAIGAAALLAVTVLGTAALAADPPPTPTAGATAQRTNYGDVFIGKLAAALGIDQAKLTDALKKAELDTIDQAVANGDLARNPADAMKQRVEQNGPSLGFGMLGGHGRGMMPGAMGPGAMGRGATGLAIDGQVIMKAIADKLGISVADLQSQLHSGKSLADLAKEKNLTVQDLYTAAANAAKPLLDQAVKDGKLTQADQILKQIQDGQHSMPMVGPMVKDGRKTGPSGGGMGGVFGGRGSR